ncbi:unnamed protein product [Brassica oleracea]|uniref:Uncharacterized protein n=1 Tax=Brassica oleracea TaxID=3712 RepID=A0A3P6FRN9_BRAOL|nr:unnamed protein product [Brassica oleracea]
MDGMVVDYVRPQTTRELIAISNHFQRDEKYETYFHGFKLKFYPYVLVICDYKCF